MSLSLMLSSFDDGRNTPVGIYPGAPGESFAPLLTADGSYRNIALRRMAYASSSHDYNLTAQLVTRRSRPTSRRRPTAERFRAVRGSGR